MAIKKEELVSEFLFGDPESYWPSRSTFSLREFHSLLAGVRTQRKYHFRRRISTCRSERWGRPVRSL